MHSFQGSFRTWPLNSTLPFRRFCKLFVLLMFLTGIPSVPGQVCTPSLASGVGVAFFSNGPYAYLKGTDNNLWLNWINGGHWSWTKIGVPPGTTVRAGVGVLNIADSPYVFVLDTGGNLWSYQLSWSPLGAPQGTTIKTGVGVFTYNNTIYAFVLDNDNRLWSRSGNGITWSGWLSHDPPQQGTTVSAGVGVLTLSNSPYVFVQGSDGHLWLRWMPNGVWSWEDLLVPKAGTTVTAGLGAVNNYNTPYAFVQGSDGALWANSFSGSGWSWSSHGVPQAGTTVAGGVGILPQLSTFPFVFVQGSDGQLWLRWQNANTLTWSPQGVPAPSKKVSAGVGAIAGTTHGVAGDYVFVLGSDGFLWLNWLSGNAWSWLDQSALVVNMMPSMLGGETNQDSEPFLSVDPSNTLNMVGSAFTPNPDASSDYAPVYISTQCGTTWSLNNIVPSADPKTGTGDITHAFSGNLYSGILKLPSAPATTLVELKIADPFVSGTMTPQKTRSAVDQPYVQTVTVGGNDRIYVGNNDESVPPHTATVDVSLDGGATYKSVRLDPRPDTNPSDGASIRVSIALDNTIYAAYFELTNQVTDFVTANVVVVRDDQGATGSAPFTSLISTNDRYSGVFVAENRRIPWTETEVEPGTATVTLGQERIGGSLSIAVDPNNSSKVYVAWADEVGNNDIYTIHVSHSKDRGVTWSPDLRTIPNATNPALAVAANGTVGFLYQQLTNGNWVTQLEQTKDEFTTVSDTILSNASGNIPVTQSDPYLGDYDFLLAVGTEFRGVFSANNTPDLANFPQGVLYQRTANFTTHTLLDEHRNSVPVSIDPFFFSVPVLH